LIVVHLLLKEVRVLCKRFNSLSEDLILELESSEDLLRIDLELVQDFDELGLAIVVMSNLVHLIIQSEGLKAYEES